MKMTSIEIETKLIIKFKYKERYFSMIVMIIAKNNSYIIIPSILENNRVVDPSTFSEVEIIYTVKDGIYKFEAVSLEISEHKGMRVYLVNSNEDISRLNRRESYRAFVGELVEVNVTTEDGKKRKIQGIVKNISVTGMGVISKQEFEIGTTMSILYNFEGVYFHLLGKVVRKEKIRRYRAFSYGCIFSNPNNGVNRVVTQLQIRNKNERAE